jgi:hypothetical protein
MLPPNHVTEVANRTQTSSAVTLDDVIKAMEQWRANKRRQAEQIPESIWQQIFALLERFSESTLRSALRISAAQFQRKLAEYNRQAVASETPLPVMDFCEVKKSPSLLKNSLYKPAKIPATNTLVVEFCRADGQVMKIHTTTDSFAQLMKAFFIGD